MLLRQQRSLVCFVPAMPSPSASAPRRHKGQPDSWPREGQALKKEADRFVYCVADRELDKEAT